MKIDLIDSMLLDYHTALNDRVREAYLAAYSVLERTHLARKTMCDDYIKEATSAEEFANANEDLRCEGYRWNEQTQALASMALTMIACSSKSFLDRLKKLFDERFPPHPKSYKGSLLQKQVAEYKLRFGVDLDKVTAFETIREVELARNCCVHGEGKLSKDYCEQTQRRLVDEDEYINITPELVDIFILEIAQFSRGLAAEMKAVREKSISKVPE